MARARTLVLNTKVNVTGADKLTSLGKTFQNALNPKNIAGGLLAGFATSQVVSFLSDATSAAAEFQDSVAASGVIFGEELIPQMEEWGEKAAQNFGASKQEALSAANVIATLGKSAGLAGQELVEFSQEMVGLGGDLASMFGGNTQDAITAVGAALRGEMEPIRRYGVLLNEATLRQKAFELGIISSTKEALTPQQKVLAAQASILEQTADAQGDFVRTSDGMANTQRELAAELENINIEIGEKMLPFMLSLATVVKDDVLPAFRDFLDLVSGEQEFDIGKTIEEEFPVGDDSPLGRFAAFFNQTWDGVLGREDEIRASAEKIGTSYDDMRMRIGAVLPRFGYEYKAAIDHILAENERLATATPLGQFVAENMGGTRPFDAAVEELVDGLPEGMQEAQDEAAKVAKQTPGALGDSLRASLSDYQDDLDELTEMAVNSVSDLRGRTEIEGILASEALTDALNSDSTRTRLQAIELVEDLIADYELLAPGALGAGELVNPALARGMQSNLNLTTGAANAIVDAAGNPLVAMNSYPWGYQIGSALAQGMWDSMHLISDAAYAMANTVARQVRIESEPPDHSSPLYGLTKWGRNIARTYAAGIDNELGTLRAVAGRMAGALVPSFGGAIATPGVSSVGAGGGDTINFYLQWDGEPPKGRTESEIVSNLQRLLPLVRGY